MFKKTKLQIIRLNLSTKSDRTLKKTTTTKYQEIIIWSPNQLIHTILGKVVLGFLVYIQHNLTRLEQSFILTKAICHVHTSQYNESY